MTIVPRLSITGWGKKNLLTAGVDWDQECSGDDPPFAHVAVPLLVIVFPKHDLDIIECTQLVLLAIAFFFPVTLKIASIRLCR
jgi:hypothetical protein